MGPEPSLLDGMSICVFGHASVSDTEHNMAHVADKDIERLAVGANPAHTAPLSEVQDASVRAMVNVRPDCALQIVRAVGQQFMGKNPDQLLRAKRMPPLPAATIRALATGASRPIR